MRPTTGLLNPERTALSSNAANFLPPYPLLPMQARPHGEDVLILLNSGTTTTRPVDGADPEDSLPRAW